MIEGKQADTLRTISPIDGSVVVERDFHHAIDIERALSSAHAAQRKWKQQPLAERIAVLERFVDAMLLNREEIAREITVQMGRPIRFAAGEMRGFEERSREMIRAAVTALEPLRTSTKDGFERFIKLDPLGIVYVIAPWNYPYLTAVNTIVPALLAGNAVILKHSSQTPLCAERFAEAFNAAGLPEGVFQFLHLHDKDAEKMIEHPAIDFVAFTGSVRVGQKVQEAIARRNVRNRFINCGLELGGKDPAYVCEDAALAYAVENLVDGSFFNSGQSCCAIERIYVHEQVFDAFVEQFAVLTRSYILGNPLDESTTLGPLVSARAASQVRQQIDDAIHRGATPLIAEQEFPMSKEGTAYLAPQVFVNVDHAMKLMHEETFGPLIGIMKVSSDEEAIERMNDSHYGLTASIWTSDRDRAISIGDQIETGTWFMNRCDYLDPELAWTGVKDSGRGCTLSILGFSQLTRPKSYHLKTSIA